jgi:hypothetical protein
MIDPLTPFKAVLQDITLDQAQAQGVVENQ